MAIKGYGDTGTESEHRTVERVESDVAISTAVVQAVADLEGVEPIDADVNLYEAVDLDALDQISEDAPDDLVVEFTTDRYLIRVRGDRRVTVRRQ